MNVLITGSNGLVGSACARHFCDLGCTVIGFDNNERRLFFGNDASTQSVGEELLANYPNFYLEKVDIVDYFQIEHAYMKYAPIHLVIHCAAQPSHDLAATIPQRDFAVNAKGTLNMLQLVQQKSPGATFIHVSTNKVYGDSPNQYDLKELETRYDYTWCEDCPEWGISEIQTIDQSTHSLFGVSKLAADLYAQEYARYYGMNVGIFRGGCLTGEDHKGAPLHGFLSYLVKCAVRDIPYQIIGFKGKQVRDNIHADDVARAFEAFANAPRSGEVYNIGGGRERSVSILEAIYILEDMLGRPVRTTYTDVPRIGDHQVYITDMCKFKQHYPEWDYQVSIYETLERMVAKERSKI